MFLNGDRCLFRDLENIVHGWIKNINNWMKRFKIVNFLRENDEIEIAQKSDEDFGIHKWGFSIQKSVLERQTFDKKFLGGTSKSTAMLMLFVALLLARIIWVWHFG